MKENYILDTNSLNYLNDILNYLKEVQSKLNTDGVDINELKKLNDFYGGALKSNELHNDILNELKELISSINLDNKIVRTMIDNIYKSLEDKITSLELIVKTINETINEKESLNNDIEEHNKDIIF